MNAFLILSFFTSGIQPADPDILKTQPIKIYPEPNLLRLHHHHSSASPCHRKTALGWWTPSWSPCPTNGAHDLHSKGSFKNHNPYHISFLLRTFQRFPTSLKEKAKAFTMIYQQIQLASLKTAWIKERCTSWKNGT